jgi:arylsulfatase A-like enzyme
VIRLAPPLALAAALAAQDPPVDGAPPHIVLVLADDLGFGDPGCYSPVSKIPTPRIDALAAAGMRFTDAHSPASVCTPTRYGILTGRYAWRTRLQSGVLWPWDPPLLEDERLTLAELLREAGYRTACIGKWHLGWDWPLLGGGTVGQEFGRRPLSPAERQGVQARIDFGRAIGGGPLAHGFEHYFGDGVPNFPPYAFVEDERLTARPTAVNDERMFGHDGPMAPGWDLALVLPTIAQRAASWIDEQALRGDGRPFFLYVPLTSPHTPIAPTSRWAGRTEAGAYGDFVAETDWVLGEIVDALDRNGLGERTLLIFSSDNGSPQRDGRGHSGAVGSVRERHGHDPSHPWRGLKSDIWEGGHRVPFVVRWPGRVPAGTVCDEAVVLTDLYRTVATMVGRALPDEAGEDSFDIGPLLRGDPLGEPIRDHLVHHSGQGLFAIRAEGFKLILGRTSGGFSRWTPPEDAPEGQLYDLVRDPGEEHNLYAERPEIVARLSARLAQIRDEGRSHPR